MHKQLLLIFIFSLISHSESALSISASVDRQTLAINETLRLTITIDETARQNIDFSQLEHQFDILNTQRNSQTSLNNGKLLSTTRWSLLLAPKEKGQLTIPSFEYKNHYSQAITLIVEEDSTSTQTNDADFEVLLEASVDKKVVYVQEQVILTLRLYYNTALSSYNTEDILLENTTIENTEDVSFQAQLKGKNYDVLEKNYILHPQASGELKIPAQKWRLDKPIRSFSFGSSSNPYLYTSSKPITINVKPISQNSTAKNWMPASNVTLSQQWQQSILTAKVGEPLNYQLTLTANGLTAAQLPDLKLPQIDNFTIYGDQSTTDTNKSSDGITGMRRNNFAIIPRKTGEFTFPEIKVKWWNTTSNKEAIITLPSQTIIVAQGQLNQEEKLPQHSPASPINKAIESHSSSLFWQVMTLLLSITCGALFFLLYRSYKYQKNNVSIHEVSNKPRRFSIKNLKKIAETNDHQAFRSTIILWAKEKLNDENLNSLSAIGRKFPELQTALEGLDKQLYGETNDNTYNPQILIEQLKSIDVNQYTQNHSALKPLYPS